MKRATFVNGAGSKVHRAEVQAERAAYDARGMGWRRERLKR